MLDEVNLRKSTIKSLSGENAPFLPESSSASHELISASGGAESSSSDSRHAQRSTDLSVVSDTSNEDSSRESEGLAVEDALQATIGTGAH